MNKEMVENNCLNMQYLLLKGMFFDDKKETDNYTLCTIIFYIVASTGID